MSQAAGSIGALGTFRHEALFYDGIEEFLDATVPFITDGLTAGEPILVVVSAAKIERLRGELNGDASRVSFADMAVVGDNPARIIPTWRQFLDDNGGGRRRVRGIGEPMWAARADAELVECERHEALLNYAFDGSGGWWLLCPYDTGALSVEVIAEARASHPHVTDNGRYEASTTYRDDAGDPFDRALPAAPPWAATSAFDAMTLEDTRRFVARYASQHDLLSAREDELTVAVGELITNSVRHGGGAGVVRVWHDDGRLVFEVSDQGWLANPLAGRERPSTEQEQGRGLWMVNHLCDLVQIRSSQDGTVVRAVMR
jgi:anti-sigma regulatory factor (Ser/Thr protein kinase)